MHFKGDFSTLSCVLSGNYFRNKFRRKKLWPHVDSKLYFFNTNVYEQSPKSLHQVVLTSILQSSAGWWRWRTGSGSWTTGKDRWPAGQVCKAGWKFWRQNRLSRFRRKRCRRRRQTKSPEILLLCFNWNLCEAFKLIFFIKDPKFESL